MKNLNIPTANVNLVDISEINYDYNGIVIVYKENNAIGYIICDNNTKYEFHIDMGKHKYIWNHDLLSLVNDLKQGYEDEDSLEFKVLEFINVEQL